ncbi:hypothetical protein [Thermodesulfovibrio yellowstonii]|uniref:IPT/TIG domain-containing protein n=1 Tax=Thermodesulfovibrio yellowstonii TaxID=28262 RepID=A0A9W6GH24_9BACT|nr:hypothetical protein [Thermodesulfovibrio islandicus]GLI53842.1 hypothetical protein TISLANDTSLP1_15350 [Thermodesulfovibrio islandicus]
MKRKILFIALYILTLPMLVFAQPQVTINPSKGEPAAVIAIEGKGFQPAEEIDIVITLDEGEKVGLGTEKVDVIKADASGAFSVKSGIPINAKPGKHKIEIIGNKGSQTEAIIEVTPKEKKK